MAIAVELHSLKLQPPPSLNRTLETFRSVFIITLHVVLIALKHLFLSWHNLFILAYLFLKYGPWQVIQYQSAAFNPKQFCTPCLRYSHSWFLIYHPHHKKAKIRFAIMHFLLSFVVVISCHLMTVYNTARHSIQVLQNL